MPDEYSRRDFLTGVLVCGVVSAAAMYALPGGRSLPQTELKLLSGEDPTGARKLLVRAWNEANPRTTVILYDHIKGQTEDQLRDLKEAAEDGEADILNVDTIHVRALADKGLIVPVKLDDDEGFHKSLIVPNRLPDGDSEYWAVPFNADVGMLFERLADGAADVPTTLVSALDSVPDGSGLFVGQLDPGGESQGTPEAFVVNVLEHALSRNNQILNTDGVLSTNHEDWQKALEPLRGAWARNRISATTTESESLNRFVGEKRFMRNWPVYFRELHKRRDVVDLSRIRVRQLPTGILGGQSLALVKNSRYTEQATDVINFLTSEQAQKVLVAYGFASAQVGVYNDSELEVFIPHLDPIRKAIEEGRPRPASANYAAFAKVVARHVRNLLIGGVALPASFTKEMQDALAAKPDE